MSENGKNRRKVYFADLTHTAQGISAPTFPFGISCVVSYALKELNSDFNFRLFKYPSEFAEALKNDPPDMICLSNYSWNKELAYKISSLAKLNYPKMVVVFGGPNFPIDNSEKITFLKKYVAVDFYIELEGELGFVDLARRLELYDFNAEQLKLNGEKIQNCSYLSQNQLVSGPIERITDINVIPSPYLTGILDPFFSAPLIPMFETTRGCPFSCTFCADGIEIKNKVKRYDLNRIREELHYITKKVSKSDEIIVTDLNFGMYQEDLQTCQIIVELQEKYKWPVIVSGSAGKNKKERVIEAATILKGTWIIGASIQSFDPEVLKAVKRSNISTDAYKEYIDVGNRINKNAFTFTEIILGLPGDTKQKHFESLRYPIENNVNTVRMFQAMLLVGTEMASQKCRSDYGLVTKFRTIPGCVGIYPFFGKEESVAEIEEIIVANKSMSFQDYIECRIMNLFIETFYGNSLFEEVFAMIRTIGVSVFDCLLYLKNHPELYTPKIQKIISEFVYQTSKDLYDSQEEAEKTVLTPEIIDKYIGGEMGINELLVHKALLYLELEEISELLFKAIREWLREKDVLTPAVEDYLAQIQRFIVKRKQDITKVDEVLVDSFNYDFNEIEKLNYKVDPNHLTPCEPIQYSFFHDDKQKSHILNQLNVYLRTPVGLGRLLQRSVLSRMYRSFECVREPSLVK